MNKVSEFFRTYSKDFNKSLFLKESKIKTINFELCEYQSFVSILKLILSC